MAKKKKTRKKKAKMQGFDTVRRELDAKRHQLEQELHSAQGKVNELQTDLERVHEALDALVGTKKKAKGRGRAPKKTVPSVHEIQGHIARVREAKPFASARDLQEEVRELVRESGGSVAGFPRRFAEALASSPGFTPSAEVTRALANAAHAHSHAHSEPFQETEHEYESSHAGAEHAHHEHEHQHGQHPAEDESAGHEDEGPFVA